ncbi:Stk1 family PASTA domain-containing Ser/Thr kinase [Salimicrobium halophilum]|uniref:Serine/threonine-protein kinase PrkC n=1 Tax=Salimicrobium halophilum TaxID=86666 RepID=A0A1G8QDU5_9BACI|nr:Stk1 family PASTA domain-containing Ser/Thr kinase [Salimicrobium halophilum]SDJ02877.1 serine/threonine protein kinase [Salimicrobium halophilum]
MLENQMLNDRYHVKSMIGGGGMANVYLAFDTILERHVAIKVLRLEYGDDDEFITRFHREAQAAISLNHPNIVNIFDVGEESDIYYMVMEYVDGMTLKKYIQTHAPVNLEEAVRIMRQITDAIGHAHENGLIHRDIKPQNILIDSSGAVKVTDFGIAMALSATALTQTNSVLGSVHYLSPEQARGGIATKKSDIYSLGIVFFELLTGRLPFSGESPVSVALKHLQHDTPAVSNYADVPQSVENIVLKSTAKDPLHRYSSVEHMDEELSHCLEHRDVEPFQVPEEEGEKTKAIPVVTEDTPVSSGGDTLVHAPGPGPKKKEKKKRSKKPWIIAFFLFLLMGAGAAVAIPMMLEPKDVEIADVTGMEYEEAYSTLRDLNLQVERETEYSDEVEEGYVIRTDPPAGSVTKEESTVTVVSSMGKETVRLEDYTGEDFESTKQELEEQGFASVFSISESSERPAGEILEQLQPSENQEVVPGETSVLFRVSTGPPKVMLRPLRNMTQEEARNYLEEEGLQMETSEQFSRNIEVGRVISQSPEAFTEVNQGTTVTVTVSLGQKQEPIREDTLSLTLPYNGEDGEEETYQIYVDDANSDGEEVYQEETITEETTVEIDVQINPGSEALYRVEQDGEIIEEGNLNY